MSREFGLSLVEWRRVNDDSQVVCVVSVSSMLLLNKLSTMVKLREWKYAPQFHEYSTTYEQYNCHIAGFTSFDDMRERTDQYIRRGEWSRTKSFLVNG